MDPRALQITTLTSGWRTDAAEEEQVLTLLRETPAGGLDAVLADLDVDEVMGDVDNHRWGPQNREALLHLLLRERVGELSTESLAQVLSALHVGPTPRAHQEAIVDTMTALEGERFADLKYRLNSTKDTHDLEHLVFDDLEDDLRDRLLAHIAEQAAAVRTPDLRVLSDIDDTVKCALHDRRYPRGTVYPGVVALITALDRGAAQQPDRVGQVTFVTARPEGPAGVVKQYTRNALAHYGLPEHTVLGGSFLNLRTKAAIAERKVENMKRDRLLFPECGMVFIGDSGQADAEVGAQMHAEDGDHVVGTLLHDVVGLGVDERVALSERGVHVFDTYAGAAVHAVRLGLLSVEQAREVAEQVRVGLELVALDDQQRQHLQELLARDLDAVAGLG